MVPLGKHHQLGIVSGLHDRFGVVPALGKAAAVIATMALSYTWMRFVVFRLGPEEPVVVLEPQPARRVAGGEDAPAVVMAPDESAQV